MDQLSELFLLSKLTKNKFVVLFFSILATSCSVIPKDHAKLTGVFQLAIWKEKLQTAKAANSSQVKYDEAREKVNNLISPRLELEVERVAQQSIFGLGGAADLSREGIIDEQTASAVKEFYDSNPIIGGAADLSRKGIIREAIIDAQTASAVREFYDSNSSIGGASVLGRSEVTGPVGPLMKIKSSDSKKEFSSGDIVEKAIKAVLDAIAKASREARLAGATELKRQLNTYKWPVWSELK